MNLKKLFPTAILILLSSATATAQFTKGLNYEVETGISFSGGEYTPFWLTANKHGLSSVTKNNGYLRAGIFRPFEKEKRFSYSFGLDVAGAYNFTSPFIIQQAYVDVRYRALALSIGSKEREGELKNNRLSSGSLTFSNNARPIPQVRIGIPEYLAIPGTHHWMHFRGHIAYGLFTDDGWQKDFIRPGGKHTEHVLYHSKALYTKIGKEESFPLVFEGGLEMAAQFGGKAINGDKTIDMPNKLKDFFKVFIPQGGGSNTPTGEQTNVYGNHLGSWNFSLSYKFTDWKIRTYYEHFFEDHSMMFGEYGWKDCLVGVELTLPRNPILGNIVYEYIGSKDQAGSLYHDTTGSIPDQISARDNYYNHGIYAGWQHWGMAIGNPLIISPIYNKNGVIYSYDNRIKAHHIGLSGEPTKEIGYRVLLSNTRSWGTYSFPAPDVRKNTSMMLEGTYKPQQLSEWSFTVAAAIDRGDLIGNNAGGMITVRKTGLFSK